MTQQTESSNCRLNFMMERAVIFNFPYQIFRYDKLHSCKALHEKKDQGILKYTTGLFRNNNKFMYSWAIKAFKNPL